MKQHITRKQLNELSVKGKIKLEEWGDEHGDTWSEIDLNSDDMDQPKTVILPLLSIGQMIEFLTVDKLCDALWEAVKEVLDNG